MHCCQSCFLPVLLSKPLTFQQLSAEANCTQSFLVLLQYILLSSQGLSLCPCSSFLSCHTCFMLSAPLRQVKWAAFCSAASHCVLNAYILHSGYRPLANKWNSNTIHHSLDWGKYYLFLGKSDTDTFSDRKFSFLLQVQSQKSGLLFHSPWPSFWTRIQSSLLGR